MQGKLQQAKTLYTQICTSDPNDAEAHYHAGAVHRSLGLLKETLWYYQRAIQIKPDYSEALDSLGAVLQAQGKIQEAVPCYTRALHYKPENFGAHYNLGTAYATLGKLPQAVQHFQESIRLNPQLQTAYTACSQVLSMLGRRDAAIQLLEKALSLFPQFPLALRMLGHMYGEANRNEEATTVLHRALALEPGSVAATSALAGILNRKGEHQKAYDTLQPAIPDPCSDSGVALVFSSICKALRKENEAIAIIEKLIDSGTVAPLGLIKLHQNLATLYENLGDHALAFQHHEKSNRLKQYNFDINKNAEFFQRIKNTYSADKRESLPCATASDRNLVFIVGMPRSGTTLAEQILDTHSAVFGAGELSIINQLTQQLSPTACDQTPFPECIPNLNQVGLEQAAQSYMEVVAPYFDKAQTVTDKMPLNFQFLGFIQQLFPQARIIHCVRDPRDTCLSCFFQDFDARLPFTNNLEHLRQYYLQYQDLMKHWESNCTLPMLTLSYESLIQNPEPQIRTMLDFCDLAWEPECMAFHNNKRFVKTASHAQVTKPIYKDSLARWEKYRDFLSPEFIALGP